MNTSTLMYECVNCIYLCVRMSVSSLTHPCEAPQAPLGEALQPQRGVITEQGHTETAGSVNPETEADTHTGWKMEGKKPNNNNYPVSSCNNDRITRANDVSYLTALIKRFCKLNSSCFSKYLSLAGVSLNNGTQQRNSNESCRKTPNVKTTV